MNETFSGTLDLDSSVQFKMTPRGVEIAREYYRTASGIDKEFKIGTAHVIFTMRLRDLFRIFGGPNMWLRDDGSPIYDLFVEETK